MPADDDAVHANAVPGGHAVSGLYDPVSQRGHPVSRREHAVSALPNEVPAVADSVRGNQLPGGHAVSASTIALSTIGEYVRHHAYRLPARTEPVPTTAGHHMRVAHSVPRRRVWKPGRGACRGCRQAGVGIGLSDRGGRLPYN